MNNAISIGFKLKKYIGKKVICKHTMELGVIAGHYVKKDSNGEYTVDYVIKMDKEGLHLRMINEKDIVILIDSEGV